MRTSVGAKISRAPRNRAISLKLAGASMPIRRIARRKGPLADLFNWRLIAAGNLGYAQDRLLAYAKAGLASADFG